MGGGHAAAGMALDAARYRRATPIKYKINALNFSRFAVKCGIIELSYLYCFRRIGGSGYPRLLSLSLGRIYHEGLSAATVLEPMRVIHPYFRRLDVHLK